MLWACFTLPNLAMDAVLRSHPDPDRPLVLLDGHAHDRHLVAVNVAARQAGLYAGQKLATAQALLADFEMRPYDAAATAGWLRFLAALAYQFSAEVCLMPGAIALEISHSQRLFGAWPQLFERLQQLLQAQGFQHRLAAAPTPQAAAVMAAERPLQAVTGRGELHAALRGVAVERIGFSGNTCARLKAMGLRTMGQVLQMDRSHLQRRFGQDMVSLLAKLLGEAPDGLERFRPADVFDHHVELSHEVENTGALIFPLRRLTQDLASYLAGRDGGVQHFVLCLDHHGRPATRLDIRLLAPERDAAMLFETARGRLEALQLPAPVLDLRLKARHLPPFVPEGRDLFDTRPAHAIPMAQLRERLRARLGDEAIYRLAPTVDPRPERAQHKGPADTVQTAPQPRPSWLLTQPVPLRGAPPRILAGPERMETGWWDEGGIRRDYYLVQTADGQRAWAFCPSGEADGWMLHGWFA
ncbi:DNA polymerase Y family protein [Oleiagrimonas sp. C23AA]|uniref:Y-family DNA polymerase n=1 Tax=Oleiagrimonas sp. C23AA TaxID=2719047 RepID=UPI0014211C18|nr:DNA polymerase Y family protein [Oleiagrimonas sp. C23AA]NII10951.1 DNA polymerase Y family protein [Oleiagrimonas sp. C23AA]